MALGEHEEYCYEDDADIHEYEKAHIYDEEDLQEMSDEDYFRDFDPFDPNDI